MSRPALVSILCAGILVALTAVLQASVRAAKDSGNVSCTVIHVYDGDTLRVRLDSGEEKRIRLIGIDAPEYNDPKEDLRLIAYLAKRFAIFHLQLRRVGLEFDRDRTDTYGRTLAYVRLDERTVFNEMIVSEGLAFAYLKYPFDAARMERIKALEAGARTAGKGLWRTGSFPEAGPEAVAGERGHIVAVRFVCLRALDRSAFRILIPARGSFEAVIPKDVFVTLPGSLDFEGRTITVTGLVEEYKGRPQIMVGLPAQIKIAG